MYLDLEFLRGWHGEDPHRTEWTLAKRNGIPLDRVGNDNGVRGREKTVTPLRIPQSIVVSGALFQKFMEGNHLAGLAEYLLRLADLGDHVALGPTAIRLKETVMAAPLSKCIYDSIRTAYERLESDEVVVWPVSLSDEALYYSREYQQTRYLQVRGLYDTTQAIKWWWASSFDPSVIYHRNARKMFHHDATITVAVQPLI